jgi:hypothetical protein
MTNLTRTLAILLVGSLGLSARADETKIPLDQVPAPILKALKAKFPGAKIAKEAVKEVEDGKTLYEVSLTADGHNIDAVAKPDGTIEAIEKEIAVADLPGPVTKAIKAKYPAAKFGKTEELTKGQTITFETVLTVPGKKPFEVVLDGKGKFIEDGGDEK